MVSSAIQGLETLVASTQNAADSEIKVALSRVAMDAFIKSARDIAENGKFDSFAGIISNAELNKFFGDGPK